MCKFALKPIKQVSSKLKRTRCNSNTQIQSFKTQMDTFAPQLIKSAPPLLIHANMDFNNHNELHIDSIVHLSTFFTQISTFREKTSTSTIVEHLQGPNSSMCTAAAPPNSLCLPNHLQCSKFALVHSNASNKPLSTSKAPNQSLCISIAPNQPMNSSNTQKIQVTSSRQLCN